MTSKAISFEGIDGSGKTLMIGLLQRYLQSIGINSIIVREPGSTPLGEMIRKIVLSHSFSNPWTDTLLFVAARIENITLNIIPALHRGWWVLLDRFHDSTIAYQGYGCNVGIEHLKSLYETVSNGFYPDWTILLDCPVEVAASRIATRSSDRTRWENLGPGFVERVRKGYIEIASTETDRFTVIDSSCDVEEVFNAVLSAFRERVKKWGLEILLDPCQ